MQYQPSQKNGRPIKGGTGRKKEKKKIQKAQKKSTEPTQPKEKTKPLKGKRERPPDERASTLGGARTDSWMYGTGKKRLLGETERQFQGGETDPSNQGRLTGHKEAQKADKGVSGGGVGAGAWKWFFTIRRRKVRKGNQKAAKGEKKKNLEKKARHWGVRKRAAQNRETTKESHRR